MIKRPIRTLSSLIENELIEAHQLPLLEKVVNEFSLSITRQAYELIDKNNPEDPIAKQFVPSIKELARAPIERDDPIGDMKHGKVKGIVHRYPDRCLLTPVLVCPIYCRFCFRKEKVGRPSETLSPLELEAAYDYINQHKNIWEVIITGGDPFILKPPVLKKIMSALNKIEHVDIIRFHTRVPFVEPKLINSEFIHALKSDKTVYALLHANHPNEFSPAAVQACASLANAGIPLLSQTVLLKGINDNIDTLGKLMRCFVQNRIKPYYLHHPDLVKGTQHFRVSIHEGKKLLKELRKHFSGLCQPTYILDIPGGHGKIALTDQSCEETSCKEHLKIENTEGNIHLYPNY